MAKLEIELSDHAAALVSREAKRVGTPESKIIEAAVEQQYGDAASVSTITDDHEEWLKQFKSWQARLAIPSNHLTNEDLRRVNMYDDERG